MFNRFLQLLKNILSRTITSANDLYFTMTTHDELQFIVELKKAFQQIPLREINNCPPSERSWIEYINCIRELMVLGNPVEFLRWQPIKTTMFVVNDDYIVRELISLRRQDDWRKRWRGAIRESRIGHPTPFWLYPRSSGNLIHHAYHLTQFERNTGRSIDKIDFVLEFGGGYGSMCRLFHNLGYKGRYLIFDLPEFSALQRSYLLSIGLPVNEVSIFMSSRDGVSCISDIDELTRIIKNINGKNALFISTWAISETPKALRNLILPIIINFDYFLIAYHAKYCEIDNIDFFKQWKLTTNNIQWSEWEIKHLPCNHYLIGKKVLL